MKISNDISINGLSQSEEKEVHGEKDEQIYSNLNLALEAEESESDRYRI